MLASLEDCFLLGTNEIFLHSASGRELLNDSITLMSSEKHFFSVMLKNTGLTPQLRLITPHNTSIARQGLKKPVHIWLCTSCIFCKLFQWTSPNSLATCFWPGEVHLCPCLPGASQGDRKDKERCASLTFPKASFLPSQQSDFRWPSSSLSVLSLSSPGQSLSRKPPLHLHHHRRPRRHPCRSPPHQSQRRRS